MDMNDIGFSATRRLILQGVGAVALVGLGNLPFGLTPALAAANDKYPEEAFKQKSEADAIKALYGKTAEPSDKVKMDAPEIAENGAVVPISVSTTLADVTSIAFLVSENPNALVASYKIPAGTVPSVANRIKMAQDQQRDRGRGSRRQALQRHQGSQSHRRRLRRLTRMIRKSGQPVFRQDHAPNNRQGVFRWHRPFACAPPRPAKPPKCRR